MLGMIYGSESDFPSSSRPSKNNCTLIEPRSSFLTLNERTSTDFWWTTPKSINSWQTNIFWRSSPVSSLIVSRNSIWVCGVLENGLISSLSSTFMESGVLTTYGSYLSIACKTNKLSLGSGSFNLGESNPVSILNQKSASKGPSFWESNPIFPPSDSFFLYISLTFFFNLLILYFFLRFYLAFFSTLLYFVLFYLFSR